MMLLAVAVTASVLTAGAEVPCYAQHHHQRVLKHNISIFHSIHSLMMTLWWQCLTTRAARANRRDITSVPSGRNRTKQGLSRTTVEACAKLTMGMANETVKRGICKCHWNGFVGRISSHSPLEIFCDDIGFDFIRIFLVVMLIIFSFVWEWDFQLRVRLQLKSALGPRSTLSEVQVRRL